MNPKKANNSFLRLPFLFDEGRLQSELALCLEMHWQEHFNQSDYSGEWSGIALRSASGKSEDIYAHATQGFRDTPLWQRCLYFQEIAGQFQCEKESIRLLRLAPGSIIKEHRDLGAGYPFGAFRLHIPIRTDSSVSFVVGGSEVPMKIGECWYADFDLPHSVTNNSPRDRVHLVIDCRRNEWSDQLFQRAGYDFAEEKRRNEPDAQTTMRMIEELERMNTEAARQLIRTLKGGNDALERE